MNQLVVFPSNLVARWIDQEPLERERDREHSPSLETAGGDAATERCGTHFPQLRYRPFERLSSLRLERMS